VLNAASPIPLYRQLADTLLADIRAKRYGPGRRIPSEHALALRYGIGRPTVRQATDLLVRRHVLERRRGAGTFVSKTPEGVDLLSLAGTLEAFRRSGVEVKTKLVTPLTRRSAPPAATGLRSEQGVYYLARLSVMKDGPVLLEDLYLSPSVFPRLERFNLIGRSLSELVQDHYHLEPVGGRQAFRVGALAAERARLLGVTARTPLLFVERSVDFAGAPGALFAQMACRTDLCAFSQTLSPQPAEAQNA
jgi:GntR family transcriptional regulator